LFVLPSHSEGLPIALLEAMSMGLPCLSTRVSGIPEALGNSTRGQLVASRDPASLAAMIARFVASPAAWRRRAVVGRKFVQTVHALTRTNAAILKLWDEAASYRRRRRDYVGAPNANARE